MTEAVHFIWHPPLVARGGHFVRYSSQIRYARLRYSSRPLYIGKYTTSTLAYYTCTKDAIMKTGSSQNIYHNGFWGEKIATMQLKCNQGFIPVGVYYCLRLLLG